MGAEKLLIVNNCWSCRQESTRVMEKHLAELVIDVIKNRKTLHENTLSNYTQQHNKVLTGSKKHEQ